MRWRFWQVAVQRSAEGDGRSQQACRNPSGSPFQEGKVNLERPRRLRQVSNQTRLSGSRNDRFVGVAPGFAATPWMVAARRAARGCSSPMWGYTRDRQSKLGRNGSRKHEADLRLPADATPRPDLGTPKSRPRGWAWRCPAKGGGRRRSGERRPHGWGRRPHAGRLVSGGAAIGAVTPLRPTGRPTARRRVRPGSRSRTPI